VNWGEAYSAVADHQRFIVGGLSAGMSVGTSGGWIQGGGHSAFAAKFGLGQLLLPLPFQSQKSTDDVFPKGVDNAVQFTIVIPSGQHITANAHKYSDLFWALRGGGAGSWGVITSVTYKTHDIFPLTMCGLNITISSPDIAQKVVTEFIKLHPTLSDAGWGGYSGLSNSSLQAFFVAPNVSLAETNATIGPFFDFVRNATGQSIY
jgi:FAD/FMN-containing dehydrogenase